MDHIGHTEYTLNSKYLRYITFKEINYVTPATVFLCTARIEDIPFCQITL